MNYDYATVKAFLKTKFNATKFRGVRHSITSIDGTLVTITRFNCDIKNKKMYVACEPETGIFELSKTPIGKIS